MILILALYLDFEGAKNILICGFGECWRFLTRVWHIDLDSMLQILALYLDFEGANTIHVL